MAVYKLGVLGKLVKKVDHGVIISPFIRTYWNKDWMPGERPTTPEGYAAAAKKYGMIPEDYKPFPESADGTNFGDYPKLDDVSAEARDPYEAYDMPEHRRNYGEPMNVNFEIYGEDRMNVNHRPRNSIRKMLICFGGVWIGGFGLFCLSENYKIERPFMPKQYPNTGEVHYTFEPLTAKQSIDGGHH